MTTTKTISVAADFSPSPAGRFPEDGPFPGAVFRERILRPALELVDIVVVDMSGTEMPGSSFLEEAFAGLVREGLTETYLKRKLQLQSPRDSDQIRVWRYIHDEALRSNRTH